MLRATIEIVPYGEEAKARPIVTLEIGRATNFSDYNNYNVLVFAHDGELVNMYPVNDHRYSDGAAVLVTRALDILISR